MENPYTITDPRTRKPMRLLFSRMDEVMKACARTERTTQDETGRDGTRRGITGFSGEWTTY